MRRVIKIGGSLLLRKDLSTAFAIWLDRQSAAENLVIVGGGEMIDAIRRLDAVHPGNPQQVHWRCVQLLQATFEIAQNRFPTWDNIESSDDFDCMKRGTRTLSPAVPTLVEVNAFYTRESDAGLPLDWRTTTDAIAAFLAIEVNADELVLLKACDVDPSLTLQQLTSLGIVDEALTEVASKVAKTRVTTLE